MSAKSRIILALPFLLAGCGSGNDSKTTTKLDAVEVQPGSASDAMIMLDDSDIDGTSVDASGGALTAEGAAAAKAEAEKAAANAPVEETSSDAEAADEAPAE
ncbi:MAG: hypothetical protein SFV20_09515 [Sphingopyxis sp.]|nr:hypothetical protein [Sphingopyxis sp.]